MAAYLSFLSVERDPAWLSFLEDDSRHAYARQARLLRQHSKKCTLGTEYSDVKYNIMHD